MFVRERDAPDILLVHCVRVCKQTRETQTNDENEQLVAIESEWMNRRVSSSWSHKWKFFTSPYISTHSRDNYFWFSHSATWYAITCWSVIRCALLLLLPLLLVRLTFYCCFFLLLLFWFSNGKDEEHTHTHVYSRKDRKTKRKLQ